MYQGKKAAAAAISGMFLLAASSAFADQITVEGEVTDSPCYISDAAASEAGALTILSKADAQAPDRIFSARVQAPKMKLTDNAGRSVNVLLSFAGGAACSNGSSYVRVYTKTPGGYYAGDNTVATNQLAQGGYVATGFGVQVLEGGNIATPYNLATNKPVAIGSAAAANNTQTWGFRLKKPASSTETPKAGKIETTFDIVVSAS